MEPQVVEVQEEQRMVGFPQDEDKGSSKNTKWIIAIIGVVIIVIIGLVFILMSPNDAGEKSATPTPNDSSLKTLPTNSPEPTATPTPSSAPTNREDISIEVLNGTGKVGDAGYLQDELEDLGYEDITAANAEDQNQEETTAIFSTDMDQAYIDEIVDRLKELYEDVRVRKQSLSDVDIRITTGTRKQSASASSTPTSSPTASPTATPES